MERGMTVAQGGAKPQHIAVPIAAAEVSAAVVFKSGAAVREVPLTKSVFSIGRDPSRCDLAEPGVACLSSVHCTVLAERSVTGEWSYSLLDNDSRNGTHLCLAEVGNVPLAANRKTKLPLGTRVLLGKAGAEFQLAAYKPQSAPLAATLASFCSSPPLSARSTSNAPQLSAPSAPASAPAAQAPDYDATLDYTSPPVARKPEGLDGLSATTPTSLFGPEDDDVPPPPASRVPSAVAQAAPAQAAAPALSDDDDEDPPPPAVTGTRPLSGDVIAASTAAAVASVAAAKQVPLSEDDDDEPPPPAAVGAAARASVLAAAQSTEPTQRDESQDAAPAQRGAAVEYEDDDDDDEAPPPPSGASSRAEKLAAAQAATVQTSAPVAGQRDVVESAPVQRDVPTDDNDDDDDEAPPPAATGAASRASKLAAAQQGTPAGKRDRVVEGEEEKKPATRGPKPDKVESDEDEDEDTPKKTRGHAIKPHGVKLDSPPAPPSRPLMKVPAPAPVVRAPVAPAPVATPAPVAAPAVHWQFKSDLRKGDQRDEAWSDYKASDSTKIENLYQLYLAAPKKTLKKVQQPKLNATYLVDFHFMVQMREDDDQRQRPIRRVPPGSKS